MHVDGLGRGVVEAHSSVVEASESLEKVTANAGDEMRGRREFRSGGVEHGKPRVRAVGPAMGDGPVEFDHRGIRALVSLSWATDGHKWLNVTYGFGIVFMRDGADLRRSFALVAGYRPPEAGYEPCVERRCDFASYRRGAVPWHVLVRAHAVGRTCRHARLGIGVVND